MTVTQTGVPADLGEVNLADPATFVRLDMDGTWQRIRAERPVWRHPKTSFGPEFWALSRYADVLSLFSDDRFSSVPGNMLPSLLKAGGDPASGKILALTDNPRHKALRTNFLKAFTPRIRALIADRLQERTDHLIGARIGIGEFDFAREVAEPIPIGTICDLLGFPPEDHERLLELSRDALSSDEVGQTEEDTWLARNELLLHCMQLMEQRRADPQDDLVSVMVNCLVDGEPLTDDEVIVNIYGFILAGDHTSRLAMVSALLEFARRPEQWRALKEARVSQSTAVDEILRWSTPVMHIGRTARADVHLGGQLIRAGDLVTAWTIAANRDESVFPDPGDFDLARKPNKHLSLGHGPHFCLGAYLGRAEITAVLNTLVNTVDSIELAGEPQAVYSTFLRGYSSLPLALTGRPKALER
ncbi:cytochrome P450 [Streptomyces canus]|uniref:cytochrome P450 n=1 Tax=Streptomyces canus TaxID=58343 RepID=UPI00036ED218|nr:cytochrome P450 [Streptomyces canus]